MNISAQWSLKSILFLGGVVAIGMAISLTWFIYSNLIQDIRHAQGRAVAKDLLNSGVAQVQRLLPGLLISELSDGNKLYLESIQSEEGLSQVSLTDPSILKDLDCVDVKMGTFVCSNSANGVAGAVTVLLPINLNDQTLKYLKKEKFLDQVTYLEDFKKSFIAVLLVSSAATVGFIIFILGMINRHVRLPIEQLDQKLIPVLNGTSEEIAFDGGFKEMREIYKKISRIISEYFARRNEAVYAAVARHVAHDIRSPLTALKMLAEHSTELHEEKKQLLQTAVTRITQIADNLLSGSTKNSGIMGVTVPEPTGAVNQQPVECLNHICESIFVQKKTEYYNKIRPGGLELIFDERDLAFAAIDELEFARVLSNIMNNAMEAIDESGSVRIVVQSDKKHSMVIVSDTGRGIAAENLAQLGGEGFTVGKQNGSGLGLYHAFKMVDAHRGKIRVDSKVGVGTIVTIQFPKMSVPGWFLHELDLLEAKSLNIVDDDPSIYHVWHQKLNGAMPIASFKSPSEFMADTRSYKHSAFNIVDFEFANDTMVGFDLFDKTLKPANAIIVTSRSNEAEIRDRCERLGLKMVPKSRLHSLRVKTAERGERRAPCQDRVPV